MNRLKNRGEENLVSLIKKVTTHPKVELYLAKGNDYLASRGTIKLDTEHSLIVAQRAQEILLNLGYPSEEANLAYIAGYLHDIGNVVNRYDHGRTGALLSYKILEEIGLELDSIAKIMGAIGNHEESSGYPVNHIAAAVIIADKSDLHKERVRKKDISQFTGRDRVNYAVEDTSLKVDKKQGQIILTVKIDQTICSVMEYFEIFLPKMLMCQRAAHYFDVSFKLTINQVALL